MPFVDVWTHGLPLSGRQTWVTSRFHLHLLAAAAGARGIAVGMKGYYDVKHESVAALGSGWPLVLGEESPAMPAQTGPLAAGLPALVARKRAEAATLYPALAGESAPPSSAAAKLLSRARNGVARRVRG